MDMPDEVLALTASLGLSSCDMANFALASKRCAAVCKAAPLRLAVAVQPSESPSEEQTAARATLQALCASCPGTAELDLRGSPLEDQDVQAALASLPGLELLQLSGCKKLSAGLPAALAQAPPHPQLRSLTLQRCFQLTAAALTDVMAAAARPGSRLSSAALSHLSLAGWPEESGGAALPRSRLRMLALHNCGKLSGAALQAIAASCPQLEVLMLGGASFVVEEETAAAAEGGEAGRLPADPALPCPCGEAAHLYQQALDAVLEGAPALGGGFGGYVADVAAQLAVMSCRLPHLRVLELTHAPLGLVPALQRLAATEPLLLAGRPEPLQVWDLTSAASVGRVLEWRREVRRRHHGAAAAGSSGAITPADAAAFLCAAVNCSSAARQTALHAAVEEASPRQLPALLGLGAVVDARDRSGSTPLFVACEAGHLRSVECLLGAGASATLKNSAGEAPLLIAALKGHERVVDLLLQHCHERRIGWRAHRDGDSWNPLMAAAVGGRTSIALKLLQAAGQEAADLVQAPNRYGATSLHIAARKGSASLLRALVDAGGAASLLRADANGKTAADYARSMHNGSAMRVLSDASNIARREQQRQRATVPTAERPRAHEHHQQHPQRWVGRRLQQRKGGSGGQSGTGH
ncbi:hypothetical protein CHLNCDRAFT_142986 [Chlorella variabilis]|uniref:Uncharacterized protein n=1 Tax=Chlorella variabilis TaxID=554065 RepID=E1Z982_CHLVA|nr:hypothetical protein CHLNCDRAFT_142986 [Chlorella variabilis]EFN57472.1 hypothetical protein CHLNCDRAFT_142986 [Chlorella variabilis]|eukprot:XP_005849574.1 hypothetical protein CHLNCDRAFT_142986 [Chlorella variabilis]